MKKQEALDLIVKQATQGELIFPTHMAAAIKLQQQLDDPTCPLDVAAELVLTEPLIAARLVAIANSVAFTRAGAHVSNVQTAVKLMGVKRLKTLVSSIVVRQMAAEIDDIALRQQADQLWQHSAHVAALAKVIAREFTEVDPETAMFAGIVHEIDGFYLLSRAHEIQSLLEDDAEASSLESRATLSLGILQTLKLPKLVSTAVQALFTDSYQRPPTSCGDVVSLANALASIPAPSMGWAGATATFAASDLEFEVNSKKLTSVLSTFAQELEETRASLMA